MKTLFSGTPVDKAKMASLIETGLRSGEVEEDRGFWLAIRKDDDRFVGCAGGIALAEHCGIEQAWDVLESSPPLEQDEEVARVLGIPVMLMYQVSFLHIRGVPAADIATELRKSAEPELAAA